MKQKFLMPEKTLETQTFCVSLRGNLNIRIDRNGNKLIYDGNEFATLEYNYERKDIKNAIKKYVEKLEWPELVYIYDKENEIIYYHFYETESEGVSFYLYSDYDRFFITCHTLQSSHYTCHYISNCFNDVTEYLLDNFPLQYNHVLFTEDAEPEGIDFYFLYGCIHDGTLFDMIKSKYFCYL